MKTPAAMTGKRRVEIALRGGKPDLIPIIPIYDAGYILKGIGRDVREWITASSDERVGFIEEGMLMHPDIDGYYVHTGTKDTWIDTHEVEKFESYWRITDTETDEQFGLLPDGSACTAEGESLARQGGDITGVSRIRTVADIEEVPGAVPTASQITESGLFTPLRHLTRKYPDRHFSFQSATPMVGALSACGGYIEDLTTMVEKPFLFLKLLARLTEHACAQFSVAREAGADSMP